MSKVAAPIEQHRRNFEEAVLAILRLADELDGERPNAKDVNLEAGWGNVANSGTLARRLAIGTDFDRLGALVVPVALAFEVAGFPDYRARENHRKDDRLKEARKRAGPQIRDYRRRMTWWMVERILDRGEPKISLKRLGLAVGYETPHGIGQSMPDSLPDRTRRTGIYRLYRERVLRPKNEAVLAKRAERAERTEPDYYDALGIGPDPSAAAETFEVRREPAETEVGSWPRAGALAGETKEAVLDALGPTPSALVSERVRSWLGTLREIEAYTSARLLVSAGAPKAIGLDPVDEEAP